MAGKKKLLLAVVATLILEFSTATDGAGTSLARNGCPDKCGDVSIPYPFGMGKAGCFLKGFEVNCTSDKVPVLNSTGTRLLEINLTSGEARVENNNISVACDISHEKTRHGTFLPIGRFFMVSRTKNMFTAVGCSTIALISGDIQTPIMEDSTLDAKGFYSVSACGVFCLDDSSFSNTDCSGRGCCQYEIPKNLRSFFPCFYSNDYVIGGQNFTNCSYAFVAESDWFQFDPNYVKPHVFEKEKLSGQRPPLVLDWVVDNTTCDAVTKMGSSLCADTNSVCINVTSGHRCICTTGYDGNPYLIEGCQDINECHYPSLYPCNGTCTNTNGGYNCSCREGTQSDDPKKIPCTPIPMKVFIGEIIGIGVGSAAGFIILVVIAFFMTQRFQHRRAMKLKQKYFEQNRGQLLQQLVSQRTDIAERMIITVDELAKATNNFDPARELGGGGHGTVYKGILSDLHVVAIKKSKITVQREIDEFINEVAILSQINHRNVVKILGCCLETEVPLLVYEFISNGTLYQHLHVESPRSLSWRDRLRIAAETANAIAYLHSSVSIPIIHRDIKSSNILLDDTLAAKVSDFGASRYIPIDRTGLTTVVQGTIGYLDPMYFYAGRLNDKSDVYSFGVILVELLTRKKPSSSYLSSSGDGLVAHFAKLHDEGNLVEILDPQVMDEGGPEVQEVAVLSASCIRLRGDDRPTMRQVNLALEGLLSAENLGGANNNILAEEFEVNGQMAMDYYPSPDEGQSMGESTGWYSLEQESLVAVRSR